MSDSSPEWCIDEELARPVTGGEEREETVTDSPANPENRQDCGPTSAPDTRAKSDRQQEDGTPSATDPHTESGTMEGNESPPSSDAQGSTILTVKTTSEATSTLPWVQNANTPTKVMVIEPTVSPSTVTTTTVLRASTSLVKQSTTGSRSHSFSTQVVYVTKKSNDNVITKSGISKPVPIAPSPQTPSTPHSPDGISQAPPPPVRIYVPNASETTGTFPCPICKLITTSHKELIVHLSQHLDFSARSRTKPTFAYNQDNYQCTACNLVTPHRVIFSEHVRCHTKILPYMCKLCCVSCISINALLKHHLDTHHSHGGSSALMFDMEESDNATDIMSRLGPSAPPSNVQSALMVPVSAGEATSTPGKRRISGTGADSEKPIVIDDEDDEEEEEGDAVTITSPVLQSNPLLKDALASDSDKSAENKTVSADKTVSGRESTRVHQQESSDLNTALTARSTSPTNAPEQEPNNAATASVSESAAVDSLPASTAATSTVTTGMGTTEKGAACLSETCDTADDAGVEIVSVTHSKDSTTGKQLPRLEVDRTTSKPGDPPRRSHATTLECTYHNGYFHCKTCNTKLKNIQNFKYHVFYHLHAEKNKPCSSCKQCGLVEERLRLPCPLVDDVGDCLKKHKEKEDRAREAVTKLTTVQSAASTTTGPISTVANSPVNASVTSQQEGAAGRQPSSIVPTQTRQVAAPSNLGTIVQNQTRIVTTPISIPSGMIAQPMPHIPRTFVQTVTVPVYTSAGQVCTQMSSGTLVTSPRTAIGHPSLFQTLMPPVPPIVIQPDDTAAAPAPMQALQVAPSVMHRIVRANQAAQPIRLRLQGSNITPITIQPSPITPDTQQAPVATGPVEIKCEPVSPAEKTGHGTKQRPTAPIFINLTGESDSDDAQELPENQTTSEPAQSDNSVLQTERGVITDLSSSKGDQENPTFQPSEDSSAGSSKEAQLDEVVTEGSDFRNLQISARKETLSNTSTTPTTSPTMSVKDVENTSMGSAVGTAITAESNVITEKTLLPQVSTDSDQRRESENQLGNEATVTEIDANYVPACKKSAAVKRDSPTQAAEPPNISEVHEEGNTQGEVRNNTCTDPETSAVERIGTSPLLTPPSVACSEDTSATREEVLESRVSSGPEAVDTSNEGTASLSDADGRQGTNEEDRSIAAVVDLNTNADDTRRSPDSGKDSELLLNGEETDKSAEAAQPETLAMEKSEKTAEEFLNTNVKTSSMSCGRFRWDDYNKMFLCLRCNYRTAKPVTFRRHIWKHVHGRKRAGVCNHCTNRVSFNKFTHCIVIKNIMAVLDHIRLHGLDKTPLNKQVADVNNAFKALPCAQPPPGLDEELLTIEDIDNSAPAEVQVLRDSEEESTQQEDIDEDDVEPLSLQLAPFRDTSPDNDDGSQNAASKLSTDDPDLANEKDDNMDEIFLEDTEVCRRCMEYTRKTTDPSKMVHQPEQPAKEGFYICGFDSCKFSSNNENDFKVHNLVKHASEYSYPCNYCPNDFADEDQLISHMVSHKGGSLIQIYKCGLAGCEFATNVQADFKGHYLHHHDGVKLYPCCYCKQDFNSPESLLEHVQTHVAKYALCPYCSTRSQMRIEIVQHIAEKHKNEPRRVIIHTEIMYPGKEKARANSAEDGASASVGTESTNGEVAGKDSSPEKIAQDTEHATEENNTYAPENHEEPTGLDRTRDEQTPSPSSMTANDQSKSSGAHGASRRKSKPVKRLWTGEEAIPALPVQLQPVPDRNVEKDVMHTCSKCNFKVPAKAALTKHESSHHSDTSDKKQAFKCSLCCYRCSDQKQFLGHVQFHQGSNSELLYQCAHCEYSSNQMPVMDDHLSTNHPDDAFKFEVSKMKTSHCQEQNACVLCYQIYDSQNDLLEHVGLVHEHHLEDLMYLFDKAPPLETAQTVPVQPLTSSAEAATRSPSSNQVGLSRSGQSQIYQPLIDRFHCDYCEFDTSSRAALVAHVKAVHGQTLPTFDEDEGEEEEVEDITNRVRNGRQASRRGRTVKQCSYCPYKTERMGCFLKHQEIHKRGRNLSSGYQCGYCQLIQPKRAPVLAHLKKYHSGLQCKIKKISKGGVSTPLIGHSASTTDEPLQKRSKVLPTKYTSPYSTTSLPSTQVPRMTEEVPALPKQLTGSTVRNLEQCLPEGLVFREPIECPHCPYSTKVRMNLIRHVKSHDVSSHAEYSATSVYSVSSGSGIEEQADQALSQDGSDDSDHSALDDSSSEEEVTPGSKVPEDFEDYCQKVSHMDLYKCKECVFMHRYPSKVRRHFYYKHAKYNPYQCTYCDFGAVESGKVKRHCLLMHKGLPVKVIKRSLKPLPEGHVSSVSLMPDQRSDDIEFEEGPGGKDEEKILAKYIIKKPGNIQECRCCGYSQEGASSVKRHVLAMHMQFYPYACKYCSSAMLEINKVKIHIDKAHPGQPYKIVRRKLTKDTANIDDLSDASSVIGEDKTATEGSDLTRIKQEVNDDHEYGHQTKPQQTKFTIKSEPSTSTTAEENILQVQSVESLSSGERLFKMPEKKKKLLSKCIYCGYTSHWNIKDVKLHIYRVHQRKNPFNCGHCAYGNVIRGRVRNHCRAQHPELSPVVRDRRKGMDHIMPLEETDEFMMVGVMGPNGVPITDVQQLKPKSPPKSPQKPVTPVSPQQVSLPRPRLETRPRSKPDVAKNVLPKDSKQWYLCKVCQQYGTHHLDNLLYHILARHQGQKPYKCLHCDVSKWRRGDVHVHIEQVHPGRSINDVLYMVRERRRELQQYVSLAPKTPGPSQKGTPTSPLKQPMSRTFAAAKEQKRKYGTALGLKKKVYNCHLCGQNYATAKVLWAHRRTHYTYRPFGCLYCDFRDFYSSGVVKHCLKIHPSLPAEVKKIAKPTIMEIDQTDRRVLQKGPVDTPDSPDRVESPPPAPTRYITSPDRSSDMVQIMPEVSPKRRKGDFAMKCDYCGVLRPHQQGMEVHQSKAHNGQPVSYHIVESNSQDQHMLLDEGEVPADGQCMLSCKKCSFTSRLSTVMRHHLMSHMDYKPYACSYCKFRAVRSYAIKVHLQRIHPAKPGRIVRQINKEKEALLRKGFSRYALDSEDVAGSNAIQATPESPGAEVREVVMNTCNHCSFKSKNSTIIRHHVMAHLQYKPYSCGYCNMLSIRPYDVKTHSVKMHPGKSPRTVHRKDDELEELVRTGYQRHVGPATEELFQEEPTPPNVFKPPVMPKLVPAPNSPTGTTVIGNVVRKIKQEFTSPTMTTSNRPTSSGTSATSVSKARKDATPRTKVEYHCSLCGVKKVSRVDIERHLMWDINYKPISCPYCPYRQVLICDVKRHVTTKHREMPLKILRKNNPIHELRLAELVAASTHHVPTTPSSSTSSPAPSSQSTPKSTPPLMSPSQIQPRRQISSPSSRGVIQASVSAFVTQVQKPGGTARKSIKAAPAYDIEPLSKQSKVTGIPCRECDFVASNAKYLSNHMVRHRPKKYQCSYCDQQGHYPNEMLTHLCRKHPSLPVKFEKLISTDSRLGEGSQQETLEEDQQLAWETSETTGPRTYPNRPRTKRASLVKGKRSGALVLDGMVLEMHPLKDLRGNFLCEKCDYTTHKLKNLKVHWVQHGPHRWACGHCRSLFHTIPMLKRHTMKMHPASESLCHNLITGERNIRPGSNSSSHNILAWELKKAVAAGGDEEVGSEASGQVEEGDDDDSFDRVILYNCTLCRFQCSEEDQLLEHTNQEHAIPTNKAPVRCGFCSFMTDDEDLFDEHVRNHRVFKPYQCAHCGYENFTRAKVKFHCMKVHSDLPILIMEQAQSFETPRSTPERGSSPEGSLRTRTRSSFQPLVELKDIADMPETDLHQLMRDNGVGSLIL